MADRRHQLEVDELARTMSFLDASVDHAAQKIDAGQEAQRSMSDVFEIARQALMARGDGRQVRREFSLGDLTRARAIQMSLLRLAKSRTREMPEYQIGLCRMGEKGLLAPDVGTSLVARDRIDAKAKAEAWVKSQAVREGMWVQVPLSGYAVVSFRADLVVPRP